MRKDCHIKLVMRDVSYCQACGGTPVALYKNIRTNEYFLVCDNCPNVEKISKEKVNAYGINE